MSEESNTNTVGAHPEVPAFDGGRAREVDLEAGKRGPLEPSMVIKNPPRPILYLFFSTSQIAKMLIIGSWIT